MNVISFERKRLVYIALLLLFSGCTQQVLKKENPNVQVEQKPSAFYLLLKRFSPPKVVYCIKPRLIGEYHIVTDTFNIQNTWKRSLFVQRIFHWGDTLTVSFEDSVYYYLFKKSSLYDLNHEMYFYRYLKSDFSDTPPPEFDKSWVNSTKLNIRSEPSKNSTIKGTLSLYDSVFVVNEHNEWSKILLPENMNWTDSSAYGWVFSKYLSKSNSDAEKAYTHKERLKRIALYKRNGWSKRIISAILNHKIFIGMTTEQARESWGEPDRVNRSVFRWGIHEQWVYERGSVFDATYLYFENDTLTGWQD